MVGARTRLFHAIVGLGLAGAGAACGSSSDPPVEVADGGPTSDAAAAPSDANAGNDGPTSNLDSSAPVDAADASDAWTGVPIK